MTFAGIVGAIAAAFVLAVLWIAALSWPVMLLFGAVHSFLPIVPAFGYAETILIFALIRLLFGNFSLSDD
jgi:hypothetical protein